MKKVRLMFIDSYPHNTRELIKETITTNLEFQALNTDKLTYWLKFFYSVMGKTNFYDGRIVIMYSQLSQEQPVCGSLVKTNEKKY